MLALKKKKVRGNFGLNKEMEWLSTAGIGNAQIVST